MKIIDNFILPFYQNKIESLLTSNQFPYFYADNTINLDKTDTYFVDSKTIDAPQFSHILLENNTVTSNFFSEIHRIIIKLEEVLEIPVSILRCKVNLNLNGNYITGTYNTPHIDSTNPKVITAIYYVNDSDGSTYFFDKKHGNIINEIIPKKGRLVYWKGIQFHAKACPIITNKRVVININLLPREL